MNVDETVARARQLRQEDYLEESQELLLQLLEEQPDNPLVLYEVGGSYDVEGDEKSAIPYYRRAVEAGLQGEDLQECLICLGSSQRYVGEYEEALATLAAAAQQFPDSKGIAVFLALTYYNDGQDDEAVKLLLDLLLTTTDDDEIQSYAGALEYYRDHLDEIWAEDGS